ncbi:MAG TPA: CAP domain-containing protein [bacterium]|nr:CAP domain-containing protein [bacterium]
MLRRLVAPAVAAALLAVTVLPHPQSLVLSAASDVEPITIIALPFASAAAHSNLRLENAALAWLNQRRSEDHLPILRSDPTIGTAARRYGRHLFLYGYLSHVSRDGRTLEDRLTAMGVQAVVVGENLAYAMTLPQAEDALWHSAPHRRNILYREYHSVGVGVIDGGRDGVIVVQDFAGSPSTDVGSSPLPATVMPGMP